MPTLEHEAPLVVLREQPALVPGLLHEVLGVDVPTFGVAELGDADFTQPGPAERRADLVVQLRRGPPGGRPVMAFIVEVQRTRDDEKHWAWPLYAAALHGRLRCPVCLVVLATDEATARWARRPIATLQHGSTFAPLVIGPAQMPRVSTERARAEPWLAVMSALAHGNRPGGEDAVRAVAAALDVLPGPPAGLCYDLVWAALGDAARRILEEEMQSGKYEYQSEFARRYYGEGELEGARGIVLVLAERHGPVASELRQRVAACGDPTKLRALAVGLADASDAAAVERLLRELGPGA